MAWPDTKKTLIGHVRKASRTPWRGFGLLIGEEWYYGPGWCPVDEMQGVTVDYMQWDGRNELLRVESQQEDGRMATVWWRGRPAELNGEPPETGRTTSARRWGGREHPWKR